MGRRLSTALLVGAASSAGAGLVHAAAAGGHRDDALIAWTFAVCAVGQLGWAVLAVAHPRRTVIVVGVGLNGACAIGWIAARSAGLLGSVDAIGAQDLVAAVLGTLATGAGLLALVESGSHRRVDLPVVIAVSGLVLFAAVPAMAMEPDASTTGAPPAAVVAVGSSHVHSHSPAGAKGVDAAASADAAALADEPIVSLDDARLTPEQHEHAAELLYTTRAALHRNFPDKEHVVAAGYVWIGDGRHPGGYEHFVNPSYLDDGHELDPEHVESVVLQRQADDSEVVVTAMYILEPGKTLADAPDIAGSLTPWHDHQNLCWDSSGTHLAGIVVNGQCRPGGTFHPTPPMMHVWLTEPACGPFSGIEGHGGTGCAHQHTAS